MFNRAHWSHARRVGVKDNHFVIVVRKDVYTYMYILVVYSHEFWRFRFEVKSVL